MFCPHFCCWNWVSSKVHVAKKECQQQPIMETVRVAALWRCQQDCCKIWQPAGSEDKGECPGLEQTLFSPRLVLISPVRLSCWLKLQGKAFMIALGKRSKEVISTEGLLLSPKVPHLLLYVVKYALPFPVSAIMQTSIITEIEGSSK